MLYMVRNQINVLWALVIWHTQFMCRKSGGGFFWLTSSLRRVAIIILIRGVILGSLSPYRLLNLSLGVLMYSMCRIIIAGCMAQRSFKQSICFIPRVKPFDIFLSRALANFYLFGFGVIVFAIGAHWYMGESAIDFYNWHHAFFGWILLAFFGLSFGIFSNAVALYYPFMRRVFKLILTPLAIFSGLYLEVSRGGPVLQQIAVWNPVSAGIHMVRYGFGMSFPERFRDSGYLFTISVLLLSIGLLVGRKVWRTA